MTLRKMAEKDLERILFSERELGENHWIDGREVRIVVDNDALRSRQDLRGIADLDLGSLLYFARTKDFPKRPEPGKTQVIDGRTMRVRTCNEDFGMLEVTLYDVRTGM